MSWSTAPIRIRTLGYWAYQLPGAGEVRLGGSLKHRTLMWLAAHHPFPVTRDSMLALLWGAPPDSAPHQGRLRDLIKNMRGELGDLDRREVIPVATDTEYSLAADVWVDHLELTEERLGRSQPLYSGLLLADRNVFPGLLSGLPAKKGTRSIALRAAETTLAEQDRIESEITAALKKLADEIEAVESERPAVRLGDFATIKRWSDKLGPAPLDHSPGFQSKTQVSSRQAHVFPILDKLRSESRLVTMVGDPGTGTSEMALAIGVEVLRSLDWSPRRVDLNLDGDPYIAASECFGGDLEGRKSDIRTQCFENVTERGDFLFIIDGAEAQPDAAVALALRALDSSSRVRVLAASTAPLGDLAQSAMAEDALDALPLPGSWGDIEQVYELPPLEVGDIAEAFEIELRSAPGRSAGQETAAVARFRKLQVVDPSLTLRDALSLALETAHLGTGHPTEEDIQAVREPKFDDLDPVVQRGVVALSIFDGPFSLDEATVIWRAAIQSHLVNAEAEPPILTGCLKPEAGGLFSLRPSIADATGDRDPPVDAYVALGSLLVQPTSMTSDTVKALGTRPERTAILLHPQVPADLKLALAKKLSRYWRAVGSQTEGVELLESVIPSVASPDSGWLHLKCAQLLLERSRLGDLEKGERHASEARKAALAMIKMAKRTGGLDEAAEFHTQADLMLAELLHRQGPDREPEAKKHRRRVLKRDPRLARELRCLAGWNEIGYSRFTKAAEEFEVALREARTGLESSEPKRGLGIVALRLGNRPHAGELLTEAIEDAGDDDVLALRCQISLAELARLEGRLQNNCADARGIVDEFIPVATSLGLVKIRGRLLLTAARIELSDKRVDIARQYERESSEALRHGDEEWLWLESYSAHLRGRIEEEDENFDDALTELSRSLELAQDARQPWSVARTSSAIARVQFESGKRSAGIKALRMAVAAHKEIGLVCPDLIEKTLDAAILVANRSDVDSGLMARLESGYELMRSPGVPSDADHGGLEVLLSDVEEAIGTLARRKRAVSRPTARPTESPTKMLAASSPTSSQRSPVRDHRKAPPVPQAGSGALVVEVAGRLAASLPIGSSSDIHVVLPHPESSRLDVFRLGPTGCEAVRAVEGHEFISPELFSTQLDIQVLRSRCAGMVLVTFETERIDGGGNDQGTRWETFAMVEEAVSRVGLGNGFAPHLLRSLQVAAVQGFLGSGVASGVIGFALLPLASAGTISAPPGRKMIKRA